MIEIFMMIPIEAPIYLIVDEDSLNSSHLVTQTIIKQE